MKKKRKEEKTKSRARQTDRTKGEGVKRTEGERTRFEWWLASLQASPLECLSLILRLTATVCATLPLSSLVAV